MNRREILGGGLALSASALAPLPAFAQAKYPERPIRLIVPFCAGGVVDAVARQWAERIKPHLGTVVVENQRRRRRHHRHGRRRAREARRLYARRSATPRRMVLNPAIMPKMPYDAGARISSRSRSSRCRRAASSCIPRVPAKNLKEFIAYAKANQDKLSYGSAGAGTMTQSRRRAVQAADRRAEDRARALQGRRPEHQRSGRRRGADVRPSTSPARCCSCTMPARSAFLRSPRPTGSRARRISDRGRSRAAGHDGELFTGLLAPAGTPKPIVDQIYQATQTLMQDPAMQKALTDQGLEPIVDSSPDKMRAPPQGRGRALAPVLATRGAEA